MLLFVSVQIFFLRERDTNDAIDNMPFLLSIGLIYIWVLVFLSYSETHLQQAEPNLGLFSIYGMDLTVISV